MALLQTNLSHFKIGDGRTETLIAHNYRNSLNQISMHGFQRV